MTDMKSGGVAGQRVLVSHHADAPSSPDTQADGVGQSLIVAQGASAPPPATTSGGDEDHFAGVTQLTSAPSPPDLSEIIAAIQAAHRHRCYWMEARKRADLSLGSFMRTALGWSLALPKGERDAIKTRAAGLIEIGERYAKTRRKAEAKIIKTSVSPEAAAASIAALPGPPDELGEWAEIILNTIEMRRKTDELESSHTKRMEELASTLPAYAFAEQCRGLGALGLAIIVAEAPGRNLGSLGDFPTKGSVYKRLGLAVIDGVRQGGLSKSASKETWIGHGYSRQRRSRIWTIGTSVLMSGNERYRRIYLDRKEYERARAEAEGLIVAPAGKIPKKRAAEYRSLGHIDNRARRYAEKRLICDLWRAWRRLTNTEGGEARDGNDHQRRFGPPLSEPASAGDVDQNSCDRCSPINRRPIAGRPIQRLRETA